MKRTGSTTEVLRCLNGIVMMQMSAKVGIKKHGQVAIDSSSHFQEIIPS
jgi:hypothetical protein